MDKTRKVIFITGASSGIGKATALYLAKEGAIVYGTSRSPKIDKDMDKWNIRMITMDLTDEASVKAAVKGVMDREGRIDVLFNNAGSGISGALEDTNVEEIKELFETNFFGMVRVINEVLPHMRKLGTGIIINSSSIGGVIGLPYQGVYSSTKFAVEGYSEALSKEVRRFGIKVCILEPGDFKTGFTSRRKFSAATSKKSCYYEDFLKTVSVFESDEINGCNPEIIGKLINKIIHTSNPKLRYVVGNFEQKLSVLVKKFLPGRVFEKIIINYYMGKGIKTNDELERVDKRFNL
ncbi:SDR family oxidoreductase [Clostridium thermarum]|uniref:SDR family oxidoreductase n=1 Tax=Clostridium thermarum TaxID=1716543 RepID=UPI00111EFAE2|nr:SDR family oxidoreductase [Clostridium thermarum]